MKKSQSTGFIQFQKEPQIFKINIGIFEKRLNNFHEQLNNLIIKKTYLVFKFRGKKVTLVDFEAERMLSRAVYHTHFA